MKRKKDLQSDGNVRLEGVEGEEAVGLFGLLDNGIDVGNFGDGFENFLVLILVESSFFLGLLDHLIVLLHQSPTQPRLLVLPHVCSLNMDDDYDDGAFVSIPKRLLFNLNAFAFTFNGGEPRSTIPLETFPGLVFTFTIEKYNIMQAGYPGRSCHTFSQSRGIKGRVCFVHFRSFSIFLFLIMVEVF